MNSIIKFLKGRPAKALLLIGVLLLLLPEGIKLVLIKTIADTGFGEASIDDVDLNLFSGKAAIKGLTLLRDSRHKLTVGRLAVDLGWQRLFRGIIYIEQLSIAGTRLAVVQDKEGVWEVVIPLSAIGEGQESSTDSTEQAIVLPRMGAARLELLDVAVTVDSLLTRGQLNVEQLQVNQLSSWSADAVSLNMKASWNKQPFELDLTSSPWADQPSLQARLVVKSVKLDAEIPVDGRSESVSALVSMAMNVNGQRNQQGAFAVSLDGELSVEQLAASYQSLNLASESLAWQGGLQLSTGQNELQYALSGDFSSIGFQLQDTSQQLHLLGWQQLDLKQWSFDQTMTMAFEQLQLKALDLIRPEQQSRGRLFTGLLDVQQLELTAASALTINRIAIDDGQYLLVLDKEGQLQLQNILAKTLENLTGSRGNAEVDSSPLPDDSTDTAFSVVVNEFTISEGSQLAFSDERFSVPVKQQLNINQFRLAGLDQQHSDKPASFDLQGSLGEFSSITVNGQLKPFTEKLWLDISGQLESIPLQELSPYSEAFMGYHLSRGQYDHQFELTIANDDIKLQNKLVLRRLSLESVDPDKPQPMARELDVPLGLALDMLRDGDDTIKLEVPIEGRMDNPDINISKIVNKALGSALKTGASSYLLLALQPYGAVLMAAGFVGDQLAAIKLDPVVFEPGSSEPTAEHKAYTSKIAGLLVDRPKLELTLCARANEQDRQALQGLQTGAEPGQQGPLIDEASLVDLADQRSKLIKRQLLEAGIASKRIYICQPTFDADAGSGVTVSM